MPIAYAASEEEYRAASYTVEAYYEDRRNGSVIVYSSTARSNRTGSITDFAVWEWPGACIWAFAPYHTRTYPAIYRGSLGQYSPVFANRVRTMEQYVAEKPASMWIRIYTGYSSEYKTLDNDYYAVDMYVQTPPMLGSSVYCWYATLLNSRLRASQKLTRAPLDGKFPLLRDSEGTDR